GRPPLRPGQQRHRLDLEPVPRLQRRRRPAGRVRQARHAEAHGAGEGDVPGRLLSRPGDGGMVEAQCRAPARQSSAGARGRCSHAPSTNAARNQWRWRMPTGTVKWFNDEKGFGFVTPDETGKDLFVHHSGIAGDGFKSLAEGAKVSYEAQATDKGPQAVDVRPVG